MLLPLELSAGGVRDSFLRFDNLGGDMSRIKDDGIGLSIAQVDCRVVASKRWVALKCAFGASRIGKPLA